MHTIFVGLSGGVDSAVSAALLKEQGYTVVGVFIKIWQPEFIECTWKDERLDAMRVAAALGIPFREIDLSEQYKKDVVDSMLVDYARGITPNPDVLCNRHIKFGAFAEWAKIEGADSIATGHYAEIRGEGGHLELLRAVDRAKDQSYFLYRLRQRDLARTIFPIGRMLKSEVRARAKHFGLPVAGKPDSQGLCFVGEVSMREYLSRFIPLKVGPVVDCEERVIGEHEGAPLYTLGQRHGFSAEKAAEPGVQYVIGVDISSNTIRVSPRRDDAARKSVVLVDVHWIYREPTLPQKVLVQARYHEPPVAAIASRTPLEWGLQGVLPLPQKSLHAREGKHFLVTFQSPLIASPGQSLVMYQGDVCLGGGIIAGSH